MPCSSTKTIDYQSKLDALLDESKIQVIDVKLYTLKNIFLNIKNVKIVGYKNDKFYNLHRCLHIAGRATTLLLSSW